MREATLQRLTWRLNNGRQVVVDKHKYVELLRAVMAAPLRVDTFINPYTRKPMYCINREEPRDV